MKKFFISCTINVLAAFYSGGCFASNVVDDCVYLDDLSKPSMKDMSQYTPRYDEDCLLSGGADCDAYGDVDMVERYYDEGVYEPSLDAPASQPIGGGNRDLSLHLFALAKGEECAIIQDCLSAFARGASPDDIYEHILGSVEIEKCAGIYNFLSAFARGEDRASVCNYLSPMAEEDECEIIYNHLAAIVGNERCADTCNSRDNCPLTSISSGCFGDQTTHSPDVKDRADGKKGGNNTTPDITPSSDMHSSDGITVGNGVAGNKKRTRGRPKGSTTKRGRISVDPNYDLFEGFPAVGRHRYFLR